MERYRELRKLSRSRHSEVLLVEAVTHPGKRFALKRIVLESEDLAEAAALNTEVSILAHLSHPNIVTYHESFLDNDCLCIVTDYADSGDLLQRIKEFRTRSELIAERQVWDWTVQLLQALEFLHTHRVIHRDLKSQNVFLAENGQVKLGDFGIARVLQSADLARSNVGTPYYLAPEVCLGAGYDTKADIWSLGCVLYELTTLRRPFEGDSLAAVINGVLNKDFDPISDVYSAELRDMIASMLSKKPEFRPSASALLDLPSIRPQVEDIARRTMRRPYQREISINIPTPHSQQVKEPSSAPTSALPRPAVQPMHSTRNLSFSESLLKQCPSSPNRPLLMGDFLRKKLSPGVFEEIRELLTTLQDPVRTLREQPWVFSKICGEENLSIVDVGLAFDAFSVHNKIPYPPTSTRRSGFRQFAKSHQES